jgi:hypothetical protein
MWNKNKAWLHYIKNIIAADVSSAVFLASYLNYLTNSRSYLSALEIMDLQKYKLIKDTNKVRASLRERSKVPFVFVICKN